MSWELASFCVLGVALFAGFYWYERSRPPARVVALVAALAALAVVGRIAFAPIPNVKPTTDIVLLTGYALGGAPGFCVGAVTALVSNLFFGHGPWTPWQMAAWGGVGIAGAGLASLVRGRELGRVPLAIACGLAGLAFGAFMDVYLWTLAAEQSLASYLAISSSSLSFNLAHVAGNFVFCLAIGPPLVRALRRYRMRAEVRWPRAAASPGVATPTAGRGPGPATGTAPLAGFLVLALAVATLLPQAASAGTGDAARYLRGAQNADGGLGAEPGAESNQLYTGWAALGLAAAGANPRDVTAGRRSVIDYVRRDADSLRSTGDLSRTILALEAAGVSSRSFAGRDLVEELVARRAGDGSYDGLVNQTAFAIMALEVAGGGGVGESARWLEGRQNRDGGFGFAAGRSDVDVTSAVLQALAAAGRRRGDPAREGLDYLEAAQRSDGGFGQDENSGSNAQSTAFAIQGLVAAGGRGGAVGAARDYLSSLQAGDGSVRYSQGSGQTPVWVTSQALLGLERAPFPLAAVPRDPDAGADPAGDGGGGSGGGTPVAGGSIGGAGAAVNGSGGGTANRGGSPRAQARDRGPSPGRRQSRSPVTAAGPSQGILEPGQVTEQPVEREGGSVLAAAIAAAATALFVLAARRRLRGRIVPRG